MLTSNKQHTLDNFDVWGKVKKYAMDNGLSASETFDALVMYKESLGTPGSRARKTGASTPVCSAVQLTFDFMQAPKKSEPAYTVHDQAGRPFHTVTISAQTIDDCETGITKYKQAYDVQGYGTFVYEGPKKIGDVYKAIVKRYYSCD